VSVASILGVIVALLAVVKEAERAMKFYDLLQFSVCVFSILAAGFWLQSAATTLPKLTKNPLRGPSDNGAEEFTDTGGKSHRQGAPECHAGRGAQNVRPACSCTNRTQKGEKA
jgi:hypothetical protein